ncbi:MAG: hypothetical protein WC564_00320, partial [Patescibacteria group bacterium]
MELQTITIKEYLDKKGISYTEANGELIADCVFCKKEKHLYFNATTSQYDCKVCGEQGNIFTLAKHLGDEIKDVAQPDCRPLKTNKETGAKFDTSLVEKCHQALPGHIRQYLNARGITDELIAEYKLGWGKYYGKSWITIPVKDVYGVYSFFKLRQDPTEGNNKITYPKGIEAQIYGWEMITNDNDLLVICEGELDRLLLLSKGIPAITSTHGAMTFKEEWREMVIIV